MYIEMKKIEQKLIIRLERNDKYIVYDHLYKIRFPSW